MSAATCWEPARGSLLRRGVRLLPRDGSWTDEDGRIDAAAFAAREGRMLVRDGQRAIWAFGPRAQQEQTDEFAPDFSLPDLDGVQHSLADYRGRKGFLHTWGSYCGCSFDPPGGRASTASSGTRTSR